MKITAITSQQKMPSRVNVLVDGKYHFSLDTFQVIELGIRVGKEYTEEELTNLEQESVFGKLYARALEYTLLRPHSAKEIREYLWKKTRSTRVRRRTDGEVITRAGVSKEIVDRVYERLLEKGYVDDEKFTRFWVENRNQRKGTSFRRLETELRAKGVENSIITAALQVSERDEQRELRKMIVKKAAKYDNPQKLTAYLVRQGFSFDDVKMALSDEEVY